jgi:hypothetical protein
LDQSAGEQGSFAHYSRPGHGQGLPTSFIVPVSHGILLNVALPASTADHLFRQRETSRAAAAKRQKIIYKRTSKCMK